MKFCEISTLLLSVCTVDKSKGKISQNFVAFSEYMNFNNILIGECQSLQIKQLGQAENSIVSNVC